MSKMSLPKKIRTEDFPAEYQNIISKIADVFNSFTDEVYVLLNKNLDNSNFNRDIVTIDIHINSSGEISNTPQTKYKTRNFQISGINVIGVENLDNSTTYPTSYPFITKQYNSGILTVINVTGLQNNTKYRLTLEIIG